MRIRGGARGVSAGDLAGDGESTGGGVQKKAEVSWERWWVFGEEGWGVEVVLVGKEGVRG